MHRVTYEQYSLVIDTKGALSPKEEVEAAAICLGRTTKESAKLRGVSPETCKCQRTGAKAKVDASSQCEFILALLAKGWLKLEGDRTVFSRLFGRCFYRIRAVVTVPASSFLTDQFHRAQARLPSIPRATSAQRAVAPLFAGPGTGESAFYDIPAYLRRDIHRKDFDNRCRLAQYTDRVRHHIQQAA